MRDITDAELYGPIRRIARADPLPAPEAVDCPPRSHRSPAMRIDEIWLSREPLNTRSGPDTTLARVVRAIGES